MAAPYRSTPVFDEKTLPAALLREHRTKAGVWGVIRVLKGRLKFSLADEGGETILTPDVPGLVLPEQTHRVEPLGEVRVRVDFYDQLPDLRLADSTKAAVAET
jgi:tellurite resistance-related uncharacterized protein